MTQDSHEPGEAIELGEQKAGACYRGCQLPAGMTPAGAARAEEMIIGYIDGAPEFDGVFPLEFSVRLFEAIQGTQASAPSR